MWQQNAPARISFISRRLPPEAGSICRTNGDFWRRQYGPFKERGFSFAIPAPAAPVFGGR